MPNLSRLNEQDEESDRTGVYNILGIFENLLSFIPPLAAQVVNATELLPWLLKRIAREHAYDSNKQYASEILSILLQEEREVRLKFVELKGLDAVLEAVAVSFALHNPDMTTLISRASGISQEGSRQLGGSRIHGKPIRRALFCPRRARSQGRV